MDVGHIIISQLKFKQDNIVPLKLLLDQSMVHQQIFGHLLA
jgi:hypothetical protein